MEREAILVVRGVDTKEHVVGFLDFDLYFMVDRLIAVHVLETHFTHSEGSGMVYGASLSRDILVPIVETGIEKLEGAVWNKKHGDKENPSRDVTASADKKDFTVYYSDIEGVELKESRSSAGHCQLRSSTMNKDFELTDEQFELLKTHLPKIPGIAEKLKMPEG